MYVDTKQGRKFIDDGFLKIEIKPPQKVKKTDANKEVAKLWKEIYYLVNAGKKKKNNNYSRGGTSNRNQRCTVKMYYGGTKEKHKEFLRRYMPQENKKEVMDKPTLFNDTYDNVPESELLKYEQQMDDFHFKFMVSPESQAIPSKQLIRSFIKNLEKVTGNKFSWMAVEHTNTGHKHCHILINGVDANTKEKIRFSKVVIKQTARELAANICTSLVGYRTKEEIKLSQSKLPYAYRWTKIDEKLDEKGYQIFPATKTIGENEYEAQKIATNEIEKFRLEHLCTMGLAVQFSGHVPPIYFLEKNWKKKLKIIGRYNSYLDARNKLQLISPSQLEQYSKETGTIMGIVTQRYVMDDEGVWKNAIVVENKKENKGWFVPLFFQPGEDLEGATVSITLSKNQKGILIPKINILNKLRDTMKK